MKVIKLRRGPLEHMPHLNEAELVYASDTNELYIGTAGNNTTPHFIGGALTDATKGRLIPRHGSIHEIADIAAGELFYLEDQQSLAIALDANQYLVFNAEIKHLATQLELNVNSALEATEYECGEAIKTLSRTTTDALDALNAAKRDKTVDITGLDLAYDTVTLQHLTPDVRQALTGSNDSIEVILAPGSIAPTMLASETIDFIEQDRQTYDFGGFVR